MSRFTLMFAVLLLAGCAHMDSYRTVPLPLEPGERLRIEQRLKLPDDGSRLYIQHGEAGGARDYSVWEHHCSLVVRTPGQTLPPIEAGTGLVVANVQRSADFGVWERGVINYHTLIQLEAGQHPLQALECEIWAHGYDERTYIGRTELRRLLAPVILLEKAD